MAEQVDSTDCIHCDTGTAVRATDFKSGTVLEHYRCLACGKKFRPDEVTATGETKAEPTAKLKRGSPEWRAKISASMRKPKEGMPGNKRPALSEAHKEKLRKSRLEKVGKPPKTENAANVVVGELPPQPKTVTTTSGTGGTTPTTHHVKMTQESKPEKPVPWRPIQPETADWKTPILQQLDAERMATYQRLDKVIAAIDAIKAL